MKRFLCLAVLVALIATLLSACTPSVPNTPQIPENTQTPEEKPGGGQENPPHNPDPVVSKTEIDRTLELLQNVNSIPSYSAMIGSGSGGRNRKNLARNSELDVTEDVITPEKLASGAYHQTTYGECDGYYSTEYGDDLVEDTQRQIKEFIGDFQIRQLGVWVNSRFGDGGAARVRYDRQNDVVYYETRNMQEDYTYYQVLTSCYDATGKKVVTLAHIIVSLGGAQCDKEYFEYVEGESWTSMWVCYCNENHPTAPNAHRILLTNVNLSTPTPVIVNSYFELNKWPDVDVVMAGTTLYYREGNHDVAVYLFYPMGRRNAGEKEWNLYGYLADANFQVMYFDLNGKMESSTNVILSANEIMIDLMVPFTDLQGWTEIQIGEMGNQSANVLMLGEDKCGPFYIGEDIFGAAGLETEAGGSINARLSAELYNVMPVLAFSATLDRNEEASVVQLKDYLDNYLGRDLEGIISRIGLTYTGGNLQPYWDGVINVRERAETLSAYEVDGFFQIQPDVMEETYEYWFNVITVQQLEEIFQENSIDVEQQTAESEIYEMFRVSVQGNVTAPGGKIDVSKVTATVDVNAFMNDGDEYYLVFVLRSKKGDDCIELTRVGVAFAGKRLEISARDCRPIDVTENVPAGKYNLMCYVANDRNMRVSELFNLKGVEEKYTSENYVIKINPAQTMVEIDKKKN